MFLCRRTPELSGEYLEAGRGRRNPTVGGACDRVGRRALGSELLGLPVCGRMGLPERIVDHDCQSGLSH